MDRKDFFRHNHAKIYFEVSGRGEPIVLIHGFSLDHRMWQLQQEYFSSHFQVITYDVRGFGSSSIPTHPYSHDDDLFALLNYLQIPRAHIIGLSMGGRIATNFTLSHPKFVRSLTLLDSALDGFESTVDWNVSARELGITEGKKNWLNHPLFSSVSEKPNIFDPLQKMVQTYTGWHWLHEDMEIPMNHHSRDRLPLIEVPTLIGVGENDLSYFHDIAKVLANGIRGSKQILIPGSGHFVNMEATEYCHQILSEHFK